jgi:HEAT repeat protein
MHLKLPHFDIFSFWIGILISTFIWWIIYFIHPLLIDIRSSLQLAHVKKERKIQTFGILEQQFRDNIFIKAQSSHLAAPMFSLGEIVIAPKFISAPDQNQFDTRQDNEDHIFTSIPYAPGWPELAAIYKKPMLGVEDIIASGSDFVIIGYPGMGKSVALAQITSLLAKKEMTNISTSGVLPIYFHISEVSLQKDLGTPLAPLYQIMSEYVSARERSDISEFMRNALDENQAILLIDGMDELKPADFDHASNYLKLIKEEYPYLPIITTASPDYMDGLISQNFSPISISTWSDEAKHDFCDIWGNLWSENITKGGLLESEQCVDPTLINAWLLNDTQFLSPLELTLAIWGAYAGDLSGISLPDLLSAYIQRSLAVDYLGSTIETLSLKRILGETLIIDGKYIDDCSRHCGVNQNIVTGGGDDLIKTATHTAAITPQDKPPHYKQSSYITSGGLIKIKGNDSYQISHPIFLSYLAGKNLSKNDISKLTKQQRWIGRDLTLQMHAILDDSTTLVDDLLSKPDPPLYINLFTISRWLRGAPLTRTWIGNLVAALLSFIQEDTHPVGLRCQAIISLISLGSEPYIAEKFREFHKLQKSNLQQLSALGSGALKDSKSIKNLSQLTINPSTHVRNSACLALSIINLQESIDALSILLLNGDDTQRKIAAESLSINTSLGSSVLREAASMNDLFIRRAATCGIGMIKEAWASNLLAQIQLEDPEWLVKSAAQDAIESQKKSKPALGRKLSPSTETPWIITYAGKQGIGVVPNKAPLDLLLTILQSGLLEEKIASLPYLSIMPSPRVFQAIYNALYTGEPDLREAVFITLKEMAASGIALPDPRTLDKR